MTVAFSQSAIQWKPAVQGYFVESIAINHDGCIWVATEDQGVWRFDPRATSSTWWSHFTTDNDNASGYLPNHNVSRQYHTSIKDGTSTHART
jgi:ligand-binding sensor domain-containing protein